MSVLAKRRLKRDMDLLQEEFWRAATPLAARCFAERAEDLLLADEAALAQIGPQRAARLRDELSAMVESFEKKPGRWDVRRWPHRERYQREEPFACWDREYIQHQSAVWLSERTPVKLPLTARVIRMDPIRGAIRGRKTGVGGVKGAFLGMGVSVALNAFSASRAARSKARLDELSAHRSYQPSQAMLAAEVRYNGLLDELRPSRAEREERAWGHLMERESAREALDAARRAERQREKAAEARRVEAARDAFRNG